MRENQTKYNDQYYADYMKQLRKGLIIEIPYDKLDEIEQRCKREAIKIKVTCLRDRAQVRRK